MGTRDKSQATHAHKTDHTQRFPLFHTSVRSAVAGAVSHFRRSPILHFDLVPPRPALVAIKSLDEPLSHAAILAVAAVAAVAAVVPVEVGTRNSAVVGTRDSARDGIHALSTALRTARPLGRDRIRLQQEEVEAEDGAPLGIMPFPIVAQRS